MKKETIKKQKAIILEWINDTNQWAWYAIYVGTTPVKALTAYAKQNDTDSATIEREGDEWYLKDEDVRAYYITLDTI